MSNQWVGYHIDGWNLSKSVPIATGSTKEEVQTKAIKRVLSACILDGYIQAQERNDISAEDFAILTKITEEHAEKHGLVS